MCAWGHAMDAARLCVALLQADDIVHANAAADRHLHDSLPVCRRYALSDRAQARCADWGCACWAWRSDLSYVASTRSIRRCDRRLFTVNALFYQFGNDSGLSVISVATRLIVGTLSSLVVFVPTTLISFLFKRVRRRHTTRRSFEQYSAETMKEMSLDVRGVHETGRAGNKSMVGLGVCISWAWLVWACTSARRGWIGCGQLTCTRVAHDGCFRTYAAGDLPGAA